MKILVTGGAGYIGSVTAAELLKEGHEVVVFDNLSAGHLASIPYGAEFEEADLSDYEYLDELMCRHGPFDAIMHFAAIASVPDSMANFSDYLRTNFFTSMNLLDAAVEHKVPQFIFSSTANIFAHVPGAIDPNTTINPSSPYGESKYFVERALHWAHTIHGLHVTSFRYFNAAGATETHGEAHVPEEHLIPVVLEVAAGKRDKVVVYGNDYPTPDGTCVRDYIHVEDIARAHIAVLGNVYAKQAYNLGNNQGYSVLEVIEAAQRVTGRDIPYEIGPRRPGDPSTLIASNEQARVDLDWKPRYNLEQIIASAWEWHQRHPDGYNTWSATTLAPLQNS